MNRSEKVEAFLTELRDVCKRHGLSLGHEDEHGTFTVRPWSGIYDEWLSHAFDETAAEGEG